MYKLGIFYTVIFGIILGTLNALLWVFGCIDYVRAMIPYALLFGALLLITTAILKARCECARSISANHPVTTCMSVNRYTPLILITDTIFIVFSITVLATYLTFEVRVLLAFIGCISFWIMLFSFVAMMIFTPKKRCV